ncbi:MAG: hypothetical protein LBU67_08395 [Oscillospiraceae bacterium]|nr:hypothetical protein [Oscillospiraceae bacterium]
MTKTFARAFKLALAIILLCATPLTIACAQGSDLRAVHMTLANRAAGESNVLIPTLAGHPDAAIQQRINDEIAAALHIPEALLALERATQWAGDRGDSAGIHMEGTVYIAGNVLSVAISTQGELYDGSFGQTYTAFNYNLDTGEAIALADLFVDPQQAMHALEAETEAAFAREGMNAYLEYAQVLPLPSANYSLNANGVVLYYPREQYRLLNGRCGTFYFLYHQLEPYMKAGDPLCDLLLAQRPALENPAAQALADAAAGRLPGIDAQLGQPAQGYIDRYKLVAEPDYTLDGPLFLFAAPLMQGVGLGGLMYPEDGEGWGPITSIRAAQVDLYGLRPGTSTLEDAARMLGEPQRRTELSPQDAPDMLLPPGESYWYRAGKNELEVHAGSEGVVSHILLHAGGEGLNP